MPFHKMHWYHTCPPQHGAGGPTAVRVARILSPAEPPCGLYYCIRWLHVGHAAVTHSHRECPLHRDSHSQRGLALIVRVLYLRKHSRHVWRVP